MYIVSVQEVGPPFTPQEIKRLRRENMDFCRYAGQPVVLRHMWNEDDVNRNLAEPCPACFDGTYQHVRNDCLVCYGFGFVSREKSLDNTLYITPEGIVVSDTTPSPGWVRAPRYGGFGKSVLTWLVEPDVAVDVFKPLPEGTLVQTFDAQGVAPWFPQLADNDLCINVALDPNDYTIVATNERFQLKLVQQVTIRGFGKRGRPQGFPGYKVAQTFQMSKALTTTSLYDIPYDADRT